MADHSDLAHGAAINSAIGKALNAAPLGTAAQWSPIPLDGLSRVARGPGIRYVVVDFITPCDERSLSGDEAYGDKQPGTRVKWHEDPYRD